MGKNGKIVMHISVKKIFMEDEYTKKLYHQGTNEKVLNWDTQTTFENSAFENFLEGNKNNLKINILWS